MDELTREIALKRAALTQASADKPKKYRRRGEIQPEVPIVPPKSDTPPTETIDERNDSVQSPNKIDGSVANQETNTSSKTLSYTSEEIFKALRGFGAPVLFFGETLSDQLVRLRKLQLDAHDRAHGSAAGKHDNLQRVIEKEIESEMVAAHVQKDLNHVADQNKASSLDKYREQKSRAEFEHVEDYILYFFKRLLLLWEQELNDRPDEVKRSVKGKKAAATQKQTRLYIKPLFKLLKTRETPTDILTDVTTIVDFAVQREYVNANDRYLRMSIGNAPWPMGVTMVGIHERKGREKIFSQSIAHVLNDETQRKYIQSIKRLLTYAQSINPNPSNTKNVG